MVVHNGTHNVCTPHAHAVVDPGFPAGGVPTHWGGANL